METSITIAVITVIGTSLSSFLGVLASSRLTTYRLKQLEKKVDTHNNFAQRLPVLEEQIKVINHRLTDLERGSL